MQCLTLITGYQPLSADSAESRLRQLGAQFFGACTVAHAVGEWEGIAEPVLVLTAYFDASARNAEDCARFGERVAQLFAQECIALEVRPAPGFALVWAPGRAKGAA